MIILAGVPVAVSEYTPEEWERLKKGEIVLTDTYVQNPDGSQRLQLLAKVYIKAPVKTVWGVLRDYNNFKYFMPNVKNCTILKQEGEVYWLKYEGKILWLNLSWHQKVTGVQLYKRIEYTIDKTRPNDIRDTNGFWVLDNAPDGAGAVVSFSSYIDTGIPIPEMVTRKASRSTLPKILNNLRLRVESGGTWKKPEGS